MISDNDMIYNWSNSLRKTDDGATVTAIRMAEKLKNDGYARGEACDILVADDYDMKLVDNVLGRVYASTDEEVVEESTEEVVEEKEEEVVEEPPTLSERAQARIDGLIERQIEKDKKIIELEKKLEKSDKEKDLMREELNSMKEEMAQILVSPG